MAILSGIVPHLSVRAQGTVEIPRKQRFLKLKREWKQRFFICLSNRVLLRFTNDRMEEFEGVSLLTEARRVQHDFDGQWHTLIDCYGRHRRPSGTL